ncbi:MAG TPA: addiction module protein [Kofleriaceae bacterium]|jgi:putative addiction module component (TIGR02574 family)|nr:addiction module protein [Kofleriaceae bacterium]
MAAPSTSELLKLDVQTRLEIIDELWDSVVHDLNDPDQPSSLPVSEATRALLDERMREYHADPTIGLPWDEVRARLHKLT